MGLFYGESFSTLLFILVTFAFSMDSVDITSDVSWCTALLLTAAGWEFVTLQRSVMNTGPGGINKTC